MLETMQSQLGSSKGQFPFVWMGRDIGFPSGLFELLCCVDGMSLNIESGAAQIVGLHTNNAKKFISVTNVIWNNAHFKRLQQVVDMKTLQMDAIFLHLNSLNSQLAWLYFMMIPFIN